MAPLPKNRRLDMVLKPGERVLRTKPIQRIALLALFRKRKDVQCINDALKSFLGGETVGRGFQQLDSMRGR